MASGREDRIRERAHALWIEGGRQDGGHERDWERATQEIDAEADARSAPGRSRTAEPAKAKSAKRNGTGEAKGAEAEAGAAAPKGRAAPRAKRTTGVEDGADERPKTAKTPAPKSAAKTAGVVGGANGKRDADEAPSKPRARTKTAATRS